MSFVVRKLLACVALSAFSVVNCVPWAQASPQAQASSMNLSSTASNVSAGRVLHSGAVNIDVGGANMKVTPSTMLTPAEVVALSQVIGAGTQSIQLGVLGNAVGGSFLVGTSANQHISSLVVPQGVTGVVNFAQTTNLSLTGNLTDSGSLFAVSTNQSAHGVTLAASNIFVGAGGLLSTVVPTSGLNGISGAVGNLSLTLNAVNSIVNAGTISSAGSLSLNAGGTITNSLPAGTSGAVPVIQAVNDVNLNSAGGNFVNSGLIAAQTGNVNFASAQAATDIAINNAGGSIQATSGAINVRDASYAGAANTTLTGGDWQSQQLNVNGGAGSVNVNVGQITGQLNSVAGSEHVATQTPTLTLGNATINGDPTFYNSGGDIDINGVVTASEGLVIAASGNIEATSVDAQIQNPGNNVTLIAGAQITACGTCTSSASLPGGTAVPSGNSITIQAPSGGTGGNIDLHEGGSSVAIITGGAVPSGGNVTLVAFAGTTSGTGNINLGSGGIDTAGQTNGGNVLAIAGAPSGSSFTSGGIITGGGSVSIYSATPSGSISADSHGNVTGSITPGAAQGGDINIAPLGFAIDTRNTAGTGGSVTISTASPNGITIGNTSGTGSNISSIVVNGMDSAHYGNINITDSGNAAVNINGTLLIGANVSIAAANLTVTNSLIQASGIATGAPNGLVTLTGIGDSNGMNINGTTSPAGVFAVNTNVLSSIHAGTLLLQDAVSFNLQSNIFDPLDVSGGSSSLGNYNLSLIGTAAATQFVGGKSSISIGSNNLTIVANGGIATNAGDGFSVIGSTTNANAGSIILVSAGDIGNSTGSFTLASGVSGSVGNSGNIVIVAGANNVVTAANGSSITIGTNSLDALGGSVILPNSGGATLRTIGVNDAGNVTIVAFAGSNAGSGQVMIPAASSSSAFPSVIEAGAFNGHSGDVTIIAGATSTSTSGIGNSGYTITTGAIGAEDGVGNLVVETATPNTAVPVVINTNNPFLGSAGTIISGSFLGGSIVDGAISVTQNSSGVTAISNFGTSPSTTGGNSVLLIAGSNAVTGNAAIAINGSIQENMQHPADVSIITGAAVGTNGIIAANNYNLSTGSISVGQGNVLLSSLDSISVSSVSLGGGVLMAVAGTPSTAGNITATGTIGNGGGNVILASVGNVGNISINGGINTSSGNANGGSVAVSSLNGPISISGTIATFTDSSSPTVSGGDVLLTSGSLASTSITVSEIQTNVGFSPTSPGQIYVITSNSNTQSNVSTSNTLQNLPGSVPVRGAKPVLAVEPRTSIGAGTTNIIFTPDNNGSQSGSVSGFSAGGFTDIGDASSSMNLNISIAGSVNDNKLIVPIVSAGSISIGQNFSSSVNVISNNVGVPQIAFIAPNGVTLGGGSNHEISLVQNGAGIYIASPGGAINVDNFQSGAIIVNGSIGNGPVTINNENGIVNIAGPQVTPSAFSSIGSTGFTIASNVYAPSSITLATLSNLNPFQMTAGTLFTNTLTFNINAGGATVGSTSGPIITSAANINFNFGGGNNSAFITDTQSTTVANVGGQSLTTFSVTDSATDGLLTINSTPAAGALILLTTPGSGSSIFYTGNLAGSTASITADANISGATGAVLQYSAINLIATAGSIGSVANPVVISGSGGGVSLFASAGSNVYITDNTTNDTITLANGSNPLQAGTSFNLVANGNITAFATASNAIASPNISLIATGGSIGSAGLLFISGVGQSGLTLFTQTDSAHSIELDDSTVEPITLANGSKPLSAEAFLLFDQGTITAQLPGATAIVATSIALSTSGDIGAANAPLLVSRGASVNQLVVTASAGGNVFMETTDNDNGSKTAVVLDGGGAGSRTGDPSVTGQFQFTATNGSIAISQPISATVGITLQAQNNIALQNGAGELASPAISLTANAGSIGAVASPTSFNLNVSSGTANVPLSLTASAPNGNVFITDADTDPASGSALQLTGASSAGNGTFSVVTTNGGISVNGTISSNTDIVLNANTSIFGTASGVLSAPQFDLTAATGGIGTAQQSLTVNGGTTNVTANNTPGINQFAGKVFLQSTTGSITLGTVKITDTLQLTESGNVNISALSAATSVPNLVLVATNNGSITIDTNLTASASLTLQAAGSILDPGGNTISAPVMFLNAVNGNVGDSSTIGGSDAPIVVSSGASGTPLQLTVNANNNLPQTGNVFISDADADISVPDSATILLNNGSSAGSGSSAALQSGNFSVNATNGSIGINGTISASSEIILEASTNIAQSATGSLVAMSAQLTSHNGNIGAPGNPIVLQSVISAQPLFILNASATANTAGNGNIYVTDADSDSPVNGLALEISNVSAGNQAGAGSNNGILQVTTTNGGIDVVGTVSAAMSIQLQAQTSIGGGLPGSLSSPAMSLSAATGNITSGFSIGNSGNGVTLTATAPQGSVALIDSNVGEAVKLTTGTPSSAKTSFSLTTQGDVVSANVGAIAIVSPSISISVTGGNIGTGGASPNNSLRVSGGGGGLTLTATASAVNSVGGAVNITDAATESVTLGANSSPSSAGVSFALTAFGNIMSGAGANPAIISPIISLIASGGNITANGSGTIVPGTTEFVVAGTNSGSVALTVLSNPNGSHPGGTVDISNSSANGTILSGISEADTIAITDANSIAVTSSARVEGGSILLTSPMIMINGDVNAFQNPTPGSGVTLTSTQALTVGGTGTVNGNIIQVSSGSGSVEFKGSLSFEGNTVVDAVSNSAVVTVDNTTTATPTLTVDGNFTVNASSFSPGNAATPPIAAALVVSGSEIINFPSSGSSIGTIYNLTGDVVLGKNTIINSGGKNVAIIAEGNVITSGLTTINLSGANKGNGGSLTIIAGYDFSPSGTPSPSPDTETTFTIGTPSPNGGNIDLAKVTINTSSTASATSSNGNSAGSVLMLAAGGLENAGNIVVGGITTTSSNGAGGNVTLIGQGGVIVNGAINTSGKTGGGNVILSGSQPTIVGQLQVLDGYAFGAIASAGAPVQDAGAAVVVTGAITTNSTAGNAGSVTIQADQQVTAGAISASGLNGGSVTLSSLNSQVSVGAITTNSINVNLTNANGGAGVAGDITITAAGLISTGTLLAVGGNNSGGGNGGFGGDISLATATESVVLPGDTSSTTVNIGQINVKGFINAAGGNGSSSKGGDGGDAGSVTLAGAAISVSGSTGGNSIVAAGGLAGKGGSPGSPADVTINTYAIQTLPTNLDLTSTAKSVVALAGGMFSVGLGSTPNGVAGNIKSGTTLTKTVNGNGQIVQTTPLTGNIAITVTGTGGSIIENGTTALIPILTTAGKRTMVSPSEALALFETSQNQTQELTVNSVSGKGGIAAGSVDAVEISEAAVSGQTFTAFNTSATGVILDFTGGRPIINLPTKAVIGSTIQFSQANSIDYINAGSGALTVASSGVIATSVDGGGTLVLSGTAGTWTNNGSIQADQLVIARPSTSAFTFVTGPGAATTGETSDTAAILISPTFDAGMNMTFKANAADSFLPVNFGQLALPAMYSATAQAIATSAGKLPAVSLTFSLSQAGPGTVAPLTATVGGTLTDAASLTIKGIANTAALPNSKKSFTNQTPIDIAAGATFTVGASTVSGLPTSPIQASAITTKGSITITSTFGGNSIPAVSFGTGDVITNNGASLTITATGTGGNIQLGSSNTFTDMGGNVDILAKGNVSGQTGNNFQAAGILNTASGGIELGAGTTTSALSKGFASQPTTASITGASITPNATGKQVLLLLPSATAAVTLNANSSSNASLNFTSQGVMVFQAVGSGTINLQGGTFTTVSSKPVSLTTEEEPAADLVVDTSDDADFDGVCDDQLRDAKLTLR
jgi:hypothetical protein